MKEFFSILLIFYYLLSQNALSDNEVSVKKFLKDLTSQHTYQRINLFLLALFLYLNIYLAKL